MCIHMMMKLWMLYINVCMSWAIVVILVQADMLTDNIISVNRDEGQGPRMIDVM